MARRLISLFTGAGGLDLGFEAAGFETQVAVENDPSAVATIRRNRNWPVIDQDIHQVPSKEILKHAELKEGEADILIGGPPCQPFSKSGYWAKGDSLRLDDPRAGTIAAFFRVVRDTLPRAFLLENVPGISFSGKSEGLELVARAVERINRDRGVEYRLAVSQLNAADYGVPQLRERVFVVASRDGRVFRFPPPSRSARDDDGSDLLAKMPPYATAWDAIGDLDVPELAKDPHLELRGKWARLLPSIPEGQNYLWHTERGGGLPIFGWRRRYWSFLLKLAKAQPSWTLQAQPGPAIGPFHWKNRRLSARELCRLQTIPDDYHIVGNLSAVQRQVGNAVPSALADSLGRCIRLQFLDDRVDQQSSLVPPARTPVPKPERRQAVLQAYKGLAGSHEPHPGTGLGFAAARRSSPGGLDVALEPLFVGLQGE